MCQSASIIGTFKPRYKVEIARTMAEYDRDTLVETKRLSISVLDQSLDTAMKTQEWLFRSFIGSEDNKARIESLLESIRKRAK
jgi:hypothetical protein